MDEQIKNETAGDAEFKADAEEGLKEVQPEKTVVEIPESEYRDYKVRLSAVAIVGVILGIAALALSITALLL
ncbi:MAG: hypothetical protein ACI4MH_04415 [Candidatus Coproplasma sp.]